MAKKIYTTPTLSVEEYEMIVITGTSTTVSDVSTNLSGDDALHISTTGGTGNARANNRGIWDED